MFNSLFFLWPWRSSQKNFQRGPGTSILSWTNLNFLLSISFYHNYRDQAPDWSLFEKGSKTRDIQNLNQERVNSNLNFPRTHNICCGREFSHYLGEPLVISGIWVSRISSWIIFFVWVKHIFLGFDKQLQYLHTLWYAKWLIWCEERKWCLHLWSLYILFCFYILFSSVDVVISYILLVSETMLSFIYPNLIHTGEDCMLGLQWNIVNFISLHW